MQASFRGGKRRRLLTQGCQEAEPLGLFFWGGSWTLAGWCEMRQDFRSFRLDRIAAADAREPFRSDPARGFDAYMRMVRREERERVYAT